MGYLAGIVGPQIQQPLPLVVRAADITYIGANLGFFMQAMTRPVGPAGAMWAFEPLSANAARLCRNIALNSVGNVEVLQIAVGERVGR